MRGAVMRPLYSRARYSERMAAAETWLHFGEDTTQVVQEAPVVLAVGSGNLAAEHFRHDPPSPLELENAIAAVEDEIASVHTRITRGSRLRTNDAVVRDIALEAGVPAGAEMALAVEAVEHAFQRLPSLATGKEKAATLLILRELMHHLGFEVIVVRAP